MESAKKEDAEPCDKVTLESAKKEDAEPCDKVTGTLKIATREYIEPCTPEVLEEIAADKSCEFKDVKECAFHEVYPNILLGGEAIALNKYVLEDMGVTHVVNCAQGSDPGDVNTDARYYKGTKIKLYAIRAKDKVGYRIIPFFDIAAAYIHRALQNGGKVLVHCRTGLSLSPSIVISFLMIHEAVDVRDALRHIRSKRAVFPNESFREQLCELNDTLPTESKSEITAD